MSAWSRDGHVWISPDTGARWYPTIGLEVHAQLSTRTKIFCACEVSFGAPPNSRTCPVCTGQPGALPVLNRGVLDLAVRAALAFNCDIAPMTHFDRKHYFYCDLPKNFQTSQYDHPFCSGGGVELSSGAFIRLNRIHMEEDAGKTQHSSAGSLVDLNRTGVPLIESVTEADLHSADDAHEYLTRFREVLQFSGVSSADMEKGELRCDVNISVAPEGEAGLRTKVEMKNLNSFRNVHASLEYEIPRQILAYERDGRDAIVQETRLYDPDKEETRTMRIKEGENDYRYFPCPDLSRITLSEELIAGQRALLPELPSARRARYQAELKLSEYDAGVLTGSRSTADYFEAAASLSGEPKAAANWVSNELLSAVGSGENSANSLSELSLQPNDLADIIAKQAAGELHSKAARELVAECLRTGAGVTETIQALGLDEQVDEADLESWCREALVANPRVIEEVRAGKDKALGACIGPVMKASGGRADPRRITEVLKALIACEA
jgi:aspartyl-tRNA(Asn)/glutamyl-tRNA(Gln) amidotransferase subunit B